MQISRPLFASLCATALLAACSHVPPVDGKRPYWLKSDAQANSPLESMLAYHAYAWSLSGSDWQRENVRLNTSTRSNDDSLCLRQAILAGVPAAPERSRASGLLEQCERELKRRDSRLLPLATLLRNEAAERSRSDERLRDSNRRAEELAQKLNELKSIEKNLLERSQPAPRAPKP